MNTSGTSARGTSPTIETAVRYLLRPLVRLLLMHNITFQTFCDSVRAAYVRVADEEFCLADKPQTDSRISLLTGIHRREVNRLRTGDEETLDLSSRASMSALVLAIWGGSPEYLDRQGMPIPLPRLAGKGSERSFETLVQSVSKDFRPRVVLDEWLRQGVVTLDEQDRVVLQPEAFVQPQDMEEKVYYFGQNIHDHLAATVHNLQGKEPPFLERCVFYDRLSAESARELAEYSRVVGMKAVQAINKRAAELQRRDAGKAGAVHRTNFGIYHYSEAENTDESPPA